MVGKKETKKARETRLFRQSITHTASWRNENKPKDGVQKKSQMERLLVIVMHGITLVHGFKADPRDNVVREAEPFDNFFFGAFTF